MKASVQQSNFGVTPDGVKVQLFTLINANGLISKIADYGTIITELHVPDRQGRTADVVLGFDDLDQYLKGHPYFGCTVGRVANRIARGQFTLEGRTYKLPVNNGPNSLHGGLKGFDKVVWNAEPQAGACVKFSYTSADGEEGYPGELDVTVVVSLTDQDELRIDYRAVTNKATPVNLTNHSYFNLAGAGDVLGHELMVSADEYTPTDADLIPTGQVSAVRDTPLDFTSPKPIGSRIAQLAEGGYDHNFVIRGGGKSLTLAARVYEPRSGRIMEVRTTEPAVQFYTGNFLDGSLTGKAGVVYRKQTGFCLETQHYPDSVNHPNFPSIILRPGQMFNSTTVYQFSTGN